MSGSDCVKAVALRTYRHFVASQNAIWTVPSSGQSAAACAPVWPCAVLIFLLVGCAAIPAEPIPTLLSLDAYELTRQGKLLVIDIRPEPERHRDGFPSSAIAIPYPTEIFADDRQFVRAVDRISQGNHRLPIGLLCRRGVTSQDAQAVLRAAGYTTVYSVSDGFLGSETGPGWKAWGLPVVVPGVRP